MKIPDHSSPSDSSPLPEGGGTITVNKGRPKGASKDRAIIQPDLQQEFGDEQTPSVIFALGKILQSIGDQKARKTASISLDAINPRPSHLRDAPDEEKIDSLRQEYARGHSLREVILRRLGKRYEAVDGEDRIEAAKRAGMKEIPAIVIECDAPIAFALACRLNVTHGQNLTRGEKIQAAIQIMRNHPELVDRPVRDLEADFGRRISYGTFYEARKRLQGTSSGKSSAESASAPQSDPDKPSSSSDVSAAGAPETVKAVQANNEVSSPRSARERFQSEEIGQIESAVAVFQWAASRLERSPENIYSFLQAMLSEQS